MGGLASVFGGHIGGRTGRAEESSEGEDMDGAEEQQERTRVPLRNAEGC